MQSEMAVLIANCSLPMGEKIRSINVHSNHASLDKLNKLYPRGHHKMPTFLLDKEVTRNTMKGRNYRARGKNIHARPTASMDRNYRFIKNYLIK